MRKCIECNSTKNEFLKGFLICIEYVKRHNSPKEKDLRVWWARNVPITKRNPALYFSVKDVDVAIVKLKELAKADLKNPNVSDNVGGLEIFEDGDWCEYYDDKGRDIDDIIEEKGGYGS